MMPCPGSGVFDNVFSPYNRMPLAGVYDASGTLINDGGKDKIVARSSLFGRDEALEINSAELLSFIVLVMLMIVSPGANQILVLQSGMVLGHKAAIYNVLGITSSMLIHGTVTGMGIALVIVKSPNLYYLIKMLGVGYIAYLALASIYNAYRLRKKVRGCKAEFAEEKDSETSFTSFSKGFASNILNIQTLIVFLSIFPQFMNPERGLFVQALFLTLVFIGLLICWYALLIALIFKIRRYLIQPAIQFRIKAVTGSLLLFMAAKMLLR